MFSQKLYFLSVRGFFSGISQFVLYLSGALRWREEELLDSSHRLVKQFVSLDAHICVCHLCLNDGPNETYLQNRTRLTDTGNRLVVAKGEGDGRGIDWEFGISRCKLVYGEWIKNRSSTVLHRVVLLLFSS